MGFAVFAFRYVDLVESDLALDEHPASTSLMVATLVATR